MKKVLLVLLMLCLCSCTKNIETKNREPLDLDYKLEDKFGGTVFSYYYTEFPVALGLPKYTEEELKDISDDDAVESIDTLVDAYGYLHFVKHVMAADTLAVEKLYELLCDDFDMGIIELSSKTNNFYKMLYIKSEGLYYPVDLYQYLKFSSSYLKQYKNLSYICDDFETFKSTLIEGIPWFLDNDPVTSIYVDDSYKSIELYNGENAVIRKNEGVKYYLFNNNYFPLDTGLPELDENKLNALLECEEYEAYLSINNYVDTIRFLSLKEVDMDPFITMPFIINCISDNYDEIGSINIRASNDYWHIYIKANDLFYVLNPFEDLLIENNLYLKNKYVFSSKEEMTEYLYINYSKEENENIEVNIITAPKQNYRFIKDKNNIDYFVMNVSGCDVYRYYDQCIPVELGLPELSKEEINEIIKGEKEKVADRINTLADAICYIKEANMVFDDFDHPINKNSIIAPDSGNLHYANTGDSFTYSASGLETLKLNYAQCTASSTLLKYLLKDDYKEIGYIYMDFSIGGHCMLYFKGNDNNYYVINPAQYLCSNDNQKAINSVLDYDPNIDVCDKSLDELMNALATASVIPADEGAKLLDICTFDYNGVYCVNAFDGSNVFPLGSSPISWVRRIQLKESVPQHCTDLDYIIGLAD